MYFECHITLDPKDKDIAVYTAEKYQVKYSALEGDEIMGDDLLGYITFRGNDLYSMISKMDGIITYMNKNHGVKILRKKIEVAILDFKYA